MTTTIDVCVPMQGPDVDLFSCIFLKSLFRVSELDGSLQKLVFHIIDNGIHKDHIEGIKNILHKQGVPWFWHTTRYADWKLRRSCSNTDVSLQTAPNTAAVCEWALARCGTSKWAVLSHFDLFFRMDIIANMTRRIRDDIGMFGAHNPIMMVNRDAYRQCRGSFMDMSDFFAVPIRDGSGQYKIRHGSDRRSRGIGAVRIRGFDVGELFELVLQGYGWAVEGLEEEIASHVHHFIGGSGWHRKGLPDGWLREQAHQLINREGF